MLITLLLLAPLIASPEDDPAALKPGDLHRGGEVRVAPDRHEVRFAARVPHPRNKPCIDDFGRCIQASVGCAKADGHLSQFADHFVFHGSGAIHREGTACIVGPCECPGGLMADNRFPIDEPRPTIKFDWSKASPEDTAVIVRIRPRTTEAPR